MAFGTGFFAGLEDDINIDIDGGSGSGGGSMAASGSVEEMAEVVSTSAEVDEATDDLEETMSMLNRLFALNAQIEFTLQHIRTFGITRQFLHLTNHDGGLNTLLNRTDIPCFEDDSIDPDEVDIDTDVEMYEEGLKERASKVGAAIKNFFKMIYDKILAFFDFYGRAMVALKNKLASMIKEKQKLSFVKLSDKAVTAYNKGDYDKLISGYSSFIDAIGAIGSASVADASETAEQKAAALMDKLQSALPLSEMGLEIKTEGWFGTFKKTEGGGITPTKADLGSLGWNTAAVFKAAGDFAKFTEKLAATKKIMSYLKTDQKAIEASIKKADAETKSDELKAARGKYNAVTSALGIIQSEGKKLGAMNLTMLAQIVGGRANKK